MKKTMRILLPSLVFIAFFFCVGAQDQPPAANPAAPAAAQAQKKFTEAQLEQLVAPIALYPDGLLAQVLAASTYPVDIVEAARWIKHNPELSQDDIKTEMQNKKWDPSVKGLAFFPQLLTKLNDNLDWTKDLGDAFLAQQKDVLSAVQTMRAKAKDAGTLKSDTNQTVDSTQDGAIQIQSANPDTVYVQNYTPSTAYGSSWNSGGVWGYPDVVCAPAWPWGYYGGGWAVGFNCYWGNRGWWIGYNNNFYNNHFINPWQYNSHNLYDPRNPNDQASRQWRHDSANTRPVTQNTQQIARQLETEKRVPQSFKGEDNAASRQLRQAVNATPRGGGELARTAAGDSLQKAERNAAGIGGNYPIENLDHGFSGAMDGNLERAYSDRGYQSRSISSGSGGYSGYRGGYHGGGGHGGGRR
ncbi:MAG TPA: hypothetical protein DET40_22930 [Lentisphaeria bacterium]|nr:MAG: hypothetical protein A2X45_15855 [Lentisphaerae bacterium GWF2_50_93]HCE46409.1 hypothetical protein [Lentisphaeria bacterium]